MANPNTHPHQHYATLAALDEQPVYGIVVPALELALARSVAWEEAAPDEDAAELRGVLASTLAFLVGRDTTVRETY